jgi:hypothetical protein
MSAAAGVEYLALRVKTATAPPRREPLREWNACCSLTSLKEAKKR